MYIQLYLQAHLRDYYRHVTRTTVSGGEQVTESLLFSSPLGRWGILPWVYYRVGCNIDHRFLTFNTASQSEKAVRENTMSWLVETPACAENTIDWNWIPRAIQKKRFVRTRCLDWSRQLRWGYYRLKLKSWRCFRKRRKQEREKLSKTLIRFLCFRVEDSCKYELPK